MASMNYFWLIFTKSTFHYVQENEGVFGTIRRPGEQEMFLWASGSLNMHCSHLIDLYLQSLL
jgi:hypothetical protein